MQGWQAVQAEALRRIQTREWAPGATIPKEAELAEEFGCARATVNRALQALADDGWLERRRRAGTRVAVTPQRHARLVVPVLREEVERSGKSHGHRLLHRTLAPKTLYLHSLHLADGAPYAVEDREIDLAAMPHAAEVDFATVSANEWLVQNAPFDHGTMSYGAAPAGSFEARYLLCAEGAALLVLDRETFTKNSRITKVRTAFAPSHRVTLAL